MIDLLLRKYGYDKENKVYKKNINSLYQNKEFIIRKKVAKKNYPNYLKEISLHHSISVMDKEVKKFINLLPKKSIICDIGGSWGWHWRNVSLIRPDIKIVIVDFIFENLLIAKKILKEKINKNIFLINDDCCNFYIKNNFFDAIWSVQTLQHIPEYNKILKNIYNQLKNGGYFYNCNLNTNHLVRFIYAIFNKKYVIKGNSNNYYLERSNKKQKEDLEKVFKNKSLTVYSELLFHPDLKIYTGSKNNIFGKIDSFLTGECIIKKIFARQEAFLIYKKSY